MNIVFVHNTHRLVAYEMYKKRLSVGDQPAASVGGGVLILRVRHREEVLKFPLQRLESRPLHRILRITYTLSIIH